MPSLLKNPLITLADVVRVFVHGSDLHKPLENITDAYFAPEVHKNLQAMNFRTIFRTQSYSIPHILENRATFIINSEKSGKTFSYLPAILSSIMFGNEDETPAAQGPIGIIIVRSSREVEILYKYCAKLVPRDKLKVVKASGKWNNEDHMVSLLNGCDLLITTPPCFTRLAQGDVIRMFNKNRIKHLIFDDADKMNEMFDKEISRIVGTCTRGDEHPELNPQIIVTSTCWKVNLRRYINLTCEPVVIIGSFVEAAVYAKCKFRISMNSFEEKKRRLMRCFSTGEWRTKKTVVVVNSQAEAGFLKDFLKNKAISHTVIDDKTHRDMLKTNAEGWRREAAGRMTVLLTTDETLNCCKVSCAQVLIHFSLPDNWTKFSSRFSTCSLAFLQLVEGQTEDEVSTVILLDNENFVEVPRLIEFLKTRRLLKEIPRDIEALVQVRNLMEIPPELS